MIRDIRFLISLCLLALCGAAFAADDNPCKPKSEVHPAYPEMARKLNVAGVVRVQLTLTPAGTVHDTKVLGGNPLLANAAVQAVKAAHWESNGSDTCVATFSFHP